MDKKFTQPSFAEFNRRWQANTQAANPESTQDFMNTLRKNSEPQPETEQPPAPQPAESDDLANTLKAFADKTGGGIVINLNLPSAAPQPQPPMQFPPQYTGIPYPVEQSRYPNQPELTRGMLPELPATAALSLNSRLSDDMNDAYARTIGQSGNVIAGQVTQARETKRGGAERRSGKKKTRIFMGVVAVAAVTAGVLYAPKLVPTIAAVTAGGDMTVSANCEVGYQLPIGYNLDAHSVVGGKAVETPKIEARLSANVAACLTADHPLKVTFDTGSKKLMVDLTSSHYEVGTVGSDAKFTVTPAATPNQAAAYPYTTNLLDKPDKDPAHAVNSAVQFIAAGLLSEKIEATDTGHKITDPVLFAMYEASLKTKAIKAYNLQHPSDQLAANTTVEFSNEAPVKDRITSIGQQAGNIALRARASNAIIAPAPMAGTLTKVTNPNITPLPAV